MKFVGIDHVQLAMPPGEEEVARQFYGRLLGLTEVEKPTGLKASGGCWFAGPGVQIHIGAQAEFVPSQKAHPAFLISDLSALKQKLEAAGVPVNRDDRVSGRMRGHLLDPFGNRIELIQDGDGFQQRPR